MSLSEWRPSRVRSCRAAERGVEKRGFQPAPVDPASIWLRSSAALSTITVRGSLSRWGVNPDRRGRRPAAAFYPPRVSRPVRRGAARTYSAGPALTSPPPVLRLALGWSQATPTRESARVRIGGAQFRPSTGSGRPELVDGSTRRVGEAWDHSRTSATLGQIDQLPRIVRGCRSPKYPNRAGSFVKLRCTRKLRTGRR